MSQAEDMDAINNYMRTKPLQTPEAFSIKDSFIRWFDNLSWYNRSFDQDTLDAAETRRNQLNIANAATPQAKADIRTSLSNGAKGDPRPFDPATGRVGTQVKKPTVAASPSTMPNQSTPPPIGGAPLPTGLPLVIGSRGDAVTKWQTFMGISPTTAYYGDVTAAKTKNWQKANGLTADGKVGPLTWTKAFPATVGAPVTPFSPVPVAPMPVKPTVAAANVKPAEGFKPSSPAKPATKPASGGAKAATKKVATKVVQAGMFDVGSWPLWAKVGGVVTVVGGIAAALMGQHKNPKQLFGSGRH